MNGSLFDLEPREVTDRKRVRSTSREQFNRLIDTGTLELRRAAVLKAIEAIYVARAEWPTACEIQRWLADRHLIPADGNPNHVRPRLCEMFDVGVLLHGDKRKSRETGITVLTWRVKPR